MNFQGWLSHLGGIMAWLWHDYGITVELYYLGWLLDYVGLPSSNSTWLESTQWSFSLRSHQRTTWWIFKRASFDWRILGFLDDFLEWTYWMILRWVCGIKLTYDPQSLCTSCPPANYFYCDRFDGAVFVPCTCWLSWEATRAPCTCYLRPVAGTSETPPVGGRHQDNLIPRVGKWEGCHQQFFD